MTNHSYSLGLTFVDNLFFLVRWDIFLGDYNARRFITLSKNRGDFFVGNKRVTHKIHNIDPQRIMIIQQYIYYFNSEFEEKLILDL